MGHSVAIPRSMLRSRMEIGEEPDSANVRCGHCGHCLACHDFPVGPSQIADCDCPGFADSAHQRDYDPNEGEGC